MKVIFSLVTLSLLLLSVDALAASTRRSSGGALDSFATRSGIPTPQVVQAPAPTPTPTPSSPFLPFIIGPGVTPPSFAGAPGFSASGTLLGFEEGPSGGSNIEQVAPTPSPASRRRPRPASPERRGQTPEPAAPAQVVAPAQQTQTVSTVPTVVPVPIDISTAAPAQGNANGGRRDANEGQTSTDSDGTQAQDSAARLIKPYAVSLRRRSDLGYFCAGVLIGRRHVLTAAHCVDSTLPGGDTQPEVVVGSARLSQTSGPGIQVISTESVHFSPETPEGQPDLAILKLARRANQRRVRLPDSADFLPNAGESLTGIGWGRTSTQSAFSDLVQFFQTTFVERDVCSESLNREIATFNLCMGGEGGSSCSGDNGGPIITERNPDLLVGIVGSQHACGQPIIDVHNSIAPSIDWIIETRRNT